MKSCQRYFFFYNTLQRCNNDPAPFAFPAHIQNSAGECLRPAHEEPLFYKKGRKCHHSQQGRVRQGIQYVNVYLSMDKRKMNGFNEWGAFRIGASGF